VKHTLAIIGGGNIGEAMLAGLLAGTEPRLTPDQVVVVEQAPARAAYLTEKYGITLADLGAAVRDAEIVLMAVKPYHTDDLLAQLTDHVTDEHLIMSVVGAISTARIEKGLAGKPAVVRCMPNTPVAVGKGVVGISAGAYAGDADLDRVESLFQPVARVIRVPETQLDAVTALSGSGPAYFYYVVEALIDAGVLLGLTRPLAAEMVLATAEGAAAMLRQPDADPVRLRAAVSSPGGMTIAAIREFEERAVRGAIMAGVDAARNRSVELSR
jgi:pyrroline-5-carboxylate reductase